MKTTEIKKLIRQEYAWPGGYEIFLITRDGCCLCCDCARKEYRQIAYDHIHKCDTGWRIEGYDLDCNCDEPVYCDHCNKFISAYYTEEEWNAKQSAEEFEESRREQREHCLDADRIPESKD